MLDAAANRRLILTRDVTQTLPPETVRHDEPLPPEDAAALFDRLTQARRALRVLVQGGFLRLSASSNAVRDDLWQFNHVLAYQFARGETGSDQQLRRRMAEWCAQALRRSFSAASVGPSDRAGAGVFLPHAAAILRVDDGQSLAPLANFALYHLSDRLRQLGSLSLARFALEAFEVWMHGWPDSSLAQPAAQRERAVLFNRLGDLAKAQGKLAEAERLFAQALDIAQRLADSDPANTDWQRDLSSSLTLLAQLKDSHQAQAAALQLAEQSLAIDERLAALDPTNAISGRTMSPEAARSLRACGTKPDEP